MIRLLFLCLISFSSFAIVGGVVSPENSSKVVKVKLSKSWGFKSSVCTGSIIGKYKLLTAAHCVRSFLSKKNPALNVKVNGYSYKSKRIRVPKEYMRLQEEYDDIFDKNLPFANALMRVSRFDVAIIYVNKDLTRRFTALKLATEVVNFSAMNLCGYGDTEFVDGEYVFKRKVPLHCARNLVKLYEKYMFIQGNLYKASYNSGLTGSGDSGSPLFDDNSNVIGVLSGVTRSEDGDASSYYANLLNLTEFLKE